MSDAEEDKNWKEKWAEESEKVKALETISKDVLKEYDETLKKFEELKAENELLVKKVKEKNDQIEEVNKLIAPALKEYDRLKNKYEIEKGCRSKAQSFAAEVVQKNKKLQRKSMNLLAVMNDKHFDIKEINIDDEEDDDTNADLSQYEKSLNETIDELKKEVATLKTEYSECQEELQAEKENYKWASDMYKSVKIKLKQTEASLSDHRAAIKELSKVSEAAYDEYESLKERYELEVKRRSFVEKRVAQCTVENMRMKRQSEALLSSVSPGDQLHKALMEIEDLTDKLENQRQFYDKQISELEEKLQVSGNETNTEILEKEKDQLQAEMNGLNAKLQEADEKYMKLEEEYDLLLKKYEDSKRPPPPPPPPPLPVTTNKGFLSKIKKKTSAETRVKLSGGNFNQDFNKALDEMMENIKHGRTLRPTLRPIQKQKSETKGEAMTELHNIMSQMKRTRSESDLLSPMEKDGDSELAKAFRKIKKSESDSGKGKLAKVYEEEN